MQMQLLVPISHMLGVEEAAAPNTPLLHNYIVQVPRQHRTSVLITKLGQVEMRAREREIGKTAAQSVHLQRPSKEKLL